jgi:ATP-dependent DNA ligase
MEAVAADALPHGSAWQFEPKWDGIRCLAFIDGSTVRLLARSGEALERAFPDVVEALRGAVRAPTVLDGELLASAAGGCGVEALVDRLHAGQDRLYRLAAERPARFMAFDLLAEGGEALLDRVLAERRQRLESVWTRLRAPAELALTAATTDVRRARGWLAGRPGCDGVVAKRRDAPYRPGERADAIVAVKSRRTADCVVAGYAAGTGGGIDRLLLGLYDDDGLLHHVGETQPLRGEARSRAVATLEGLGPGEGFTGRRPPLPPRSGWMPLSSALVVEVDYDHAGRHGFRRPVLLMRWRRDKAPLQCTFEQLATYDAKQR